MLFLASLLACGSPSDQSEPIRIAWDRGVGLIDNGGLALEPLIVPGTVRAGVPFTATVSTFGSTNCIRPDRSQVQGTGLQAPPCLPGWERYPRSVELTFATPGEALVRLHGRGFTGDHAFEKPVTVRP
jgi:hypothetical protein